MSIPALSSLALLLLVMSNDVWSQEESQELDLTISALAEYEGFVFFDRPDPDLFNGRNALRFLPDAELVLSDAAKLEGAVELRKDFIDPSRTRIFLDKAFLDLDFAAWSLRVGRQTISGGRAAALKPTNSFMRHDYTDFLDNEEEPIDAVRLNHYVSDWTFETIWAPVFSPDIFPLDPKNRWVGPALARSSGAAPASQAPVVEVDRSAEPPKNLSSSQLGFRATRRSGGVDWSASYTWGYDRLPTYLEPGSPSIDPDTGTATVVIRPFHERIQILGLDAETFVGPWGLRGEAAYTITSDARADNPLIDDPYLRLVVGLNRTFSRLISTHDLYVNAEFLMDRELPSRGVSNQDVVNVSLRHFFRYAVVGELEYRFTPFRTFRSQTFLNVQEGDYMVQLEFRWQPRDSMTWTFGSDLVGGPAGSFFGLYGHNDRLRMNVSFHLPRWKPGKDPTRSLISASERR